MQCAAENKRSKECGAKGGKDTCCPGLICHEYQSWRCVKDENKKCAGPNTLSKQCGSWYKDAAPECCPKHVCRDKKCAPEET